MYFLSVSWASHDMCTHTCSYYAHIHHHVMCNIQTNNYLHVVWSCHAVCVQSSFYANGPDQSVQLRDTPPNNNSP